MACAALRREPVRHDTAGRGRPANLHPAGPRTLPRGRFPPRQVGKRPAAVGGGRWAAAPRGGAGGRGRLGAAGGRRQHGAAALQRRGNPPTHRQSPTTTTPPVRAPHTLFRWLGSTCCAGVSSGRTVWKVLRSDILPAGREERVPGPFLDAVLKEKSCPVQICASAGRDVDGCGLSHKKCHISQGTDDCGQARFC